MKRQAGFTLTELLVVSAIVAILLGIGIPSYKSITNSYRMSSEANGLLGDLMYARAEAIKEGQSVTICSSTDGATCSGNQNWQTGWIIYSGNSAVAPAAGAVLRVQQAFTGNPPDTFVANPAINWITYNREGFGTTALGFPNNNLVSLHDPTNNAVWTRCVVLTSQALASVQTPATSIPVGLCN
jgi:type IV fimbrial biogenesis protein FimT